MENSLMILAAFSLVLIALNALYENRLDRTKTAYTEGYEQGFDKGKTEGYKAGLTDALQKLNDIRTYKK